MAGNDELIEGGLEEMEEVMRRAEVGRIALSDGSMPYVVPVVGLGLFVFYLIWRNRSEL